MIKVEDLEPLETVYTHVGSDGINTYIAAERLRQHLFLRVLEQVYVPISIKIANSFIHDQAISIERVNQLTEKHLADPIIFCKDGKFTNGRPDAFLVDGHHRYFRRARDGKSHILAYVLDEEIWRPFQINGVRNRTPEEARQLPILKRKY